MSSNTNRAFCRFAGVRVMMRSHGYRRPQGQQQAQPRYPLRDRTHDGYPANSSFPLISQEKTRVLPRLLTLDALTNKERGLPEVPVNGNPINVERRFGEAGLMLPLP